MEDYMPKYDGILEQWKVDLIAERARRMGFGKHDLPDVMQRVAMALRRFKFDPARSNGAQESTAVQALVDRYLRFIRRTEARYRKKVEFASQRTEPMCHADDEHLVIDVRKAIAQLPGRDRDICLQLMAGCSLEEAARNVGCSWHTVKAAVGRIAAHFRRMEVDAWLQG